jgi:hypothetical protein
MKRALLALAVAVLALTGTGCIVTSVYPFYSDDTLVFDPALLGKWLHNDGRTMYTFEKEGANAYRVRVSEPNASGETETTALVVRLFRLGDALFLDAYPAKVSDLAVGGHFLVRVERRADTITMRALDVDAFDKAAAGTAPLLHVHRRDDGTVMQTAGGPGFEGTLVMAPTAQLQAFLKDHAGEIFEKDGSTMKKVGSDLASTR